MKTIIDTGLLEHCGDLAIVDEDYEKAATFYESAYLLKPNDKTLNLRYAQLLFLSKQNLIAIAAYDCFFKGTLKKDRKQEDLLDLGYALFWENALEESKRKYYFLGAEEYEGFEPHFEPFNEYFDAPEIIDDYKIRICYKLTNRNIYGIKDLCEEYTLPHCSETIREKYDKIAIKLANNFLKNRVKTKCSTSRKKAQI